MDAEVKKYFDTFKNGKSEIMVTGTVSTLQKYPIKGNVTFDSWDVKYETLYVSVPNEPTGKRFHIEANHIVIEKK
jgi:hypothetical protein